MELFKVFNFRPEKVQKNYLHDTEQRCKISRKTDLWFGKWHEEYEKVSPKHMKVSKLGLLWDPLIQNRKSMSLKFTEESEEWCKIWRIIDLSFQNWDKEFDEFWPDHLKVSKI